MGFTAFSDQTTSCLKTPFNFASSLQSVQCLAKTVVRDSNVLPSSLAQSAYKLDGFILGPSFDLQLTREAVLPSNSVCSRNLLHVSFFGLWHETNLNGACTALMTGEYNANCAKCT